MDKQRERFSLQSAKKTTKYITRDGRKVISWRLIHDPHRSLWPVEVTVEVPNTQGAVSYVVNHNGRRYANVRSADDIFELAGKKRRTEPWPYDVMPNPIEAIQYARTKQYSRIKVANKETTTYWKYGYTAVIPNLEIGEL